MLLSRNQFFLILLILFVIGPFYVPRALWLINSKKATGRGWFIGHTLELQGDISQHLVIIFRAGNDSVFFNGGGREFHVGDPVPVRYRKDNPSDARINTFSGMWEGVLIDSLLPLLTLLILFITPGRFDPLIPWKARIRIGIKPLIKIIPTFLLLFVVDYARPCSMFKITLFGKTMVGNNEDAWRVNSRIWFETGKAGHYGAAYVGHDDGFPQGGLNEAGLVYDGFAVYRRTLRPANGKKTIADAGGFLKSILQQCGSVQEVQHFVNQYDRSKFNGGMLLFVDKSGNYLVVEADTTLLGHDEKYVLVNFCPSITPDPSVVKIDRYQRGIRFLQHKEDTSLRFCTAMMDTMHECRARIGDGTTYTSIYDLKEKLIYLYFYHDYRHCVTFDLEKELAKGDHALLMTSLFPPNPEYIRFTRFKTPFNSTGLRLALNLIRLFLVLSAFCFLLIYMRGRKYHFLWPALAVINLALAYYVYNLLSDIYIFYFDAPFKRDGATMFNLSAYFPVGLLTLFIPVTFVAVLYYRRSRNNYHLALFLLNTLGYGILLALFAYWSLYALS
jgi:hypothetical protein